MPAAEKQVSDTFGLRFRTMQRALWLYLPNAPRDLVAALVASVTLVAHTVSFGALMFPGALAAGLPIAIWGMLIGSCISGIVIAARTSLPPPLASSIDSPTAAVLALLAPAIGAASLAAGGTADTAVLTVMMSYSLITLISGAILFALGRLRCGSYFRFVPTFVVGGFMAATGWLLIAGGVRTATGQALDVDSLLGGFATTDRARLVCALAVLGILLALQRWVRWPYAVPLTLLVMWLAGMAALSLLGRSGPTHGWYLPSLGTLVTWSPLTALRRASIDWTVVGTFLPEMMAAAVVALVSLVTKVTSMEVDRQGAGDLDREFLSHGIGSLAAVPVGGLLSAMAIGGSRLLQSTGGMTRWSGAWAAAILGFVAILSFDLPGNMPVPIVAGLVFFVGYGFLQDGLWKTFTQRAWLDLFLSSVIMIVCVRYGYLAGVAAGLLGASILFTVSYSRIGVIRQHLNRRDIASHVERSPDVAAMLGRSGDAIQIYGLAGYVFFGSSEAVFERVRRDIAALPAKAVTHVVLDFRQVSGMDSSAVFSLVKLRNHCRERGITLAYSTLSPANRTALARGGLLSEAGRDFASQHLALAWCEDRLLAASTNASQIATADFETWLQGQIGDADAATDLLRYFKRRQFDAAEVLYRAGEAADCIDLVAAGSLSVQAQQAGSEIVQLRRFTTHTVVGEMGFFRRTPRSATVATEGAATLFTLDRAAFDRMRQERPELAHALYDLTIRILSDRLEFTSRTLSAMAR